MVVNILMVLQLVLGRLAFKPKHGSKEKTVSLSINMH